MRRDLRMQRAGALAEYCSSAAATTAADSGTGSHGNGALEPAAHVSPGCVPAAETARGIETPHAPVPQQNTMTLLAHDIRTPLNTIRVVCDLLAKHADPAEERTAEYLDLIRHSVGQIGGMLDEMLEIGSPGTRGDAAGSTHSVVAAVLTEVVHDQRPLAALNNVALDMTLPGPECQVLMDRAAVRQVVANLITNAIRFTAPGGRVHVLAQPIGNEIWLVVTDTGRGIAEDELPHVFDRCWHQQRHAGTSAGLGLSLVKSLVETHGGRVAAVSRVGAGSVFTVILPAVVQQALPAGVQ
jgi:signal transduction histidine kinase